MKCWGCNEDKISVFSNILAVNDLCSDCKKRPASPEVSKNYIENINAAKEGKLVRNEKEAEQVKKIIEPAKNVFGFVAGGAALLWFIVMLPLQPDFNAFIVGWAVIGFIYLFFKIFSG